MIPDSRELHMRHIHNKSKFGSPRGVVPKGPVRRDVQLRHVFSARLSLHGAGCRRRDSVFSREDRCHKHTATLPRSKTDEATCMHSITMHHAALEMVILSVAIPLPSSSPACPACPAPLLGPFLFRASELIGRWIAAPSSHYSTSIDPDPCGVLPNALNP
jgi:hypothetical protein